MTSVARTLDKVEEKAVKNPLAAPEVRLAGKGKQEYGEKRGVDTSEGYAQGKEDKLKREAETEATNNRLAAEQAAKDAQDQATSAAHQKRLKELQRKGRRAAILTSAKGDQDQLGLVKRPEARSAALLGNA